MVQDVEDIDEIESYYASINNQCNYCILSSFIFLTNVLAGLYFKKYFYAFLFLLLTLTSIVHHSSKTKLTNLLDKIALYSIIFYGAYKFYEHYANTTTSTKDLTIIIKYILIVTTFLSVVYLYSYGYLTNNYVFHSEYKTSQLYHCLMHIISSLGHHIIIAL